MLEAAGRTFGDMRRASLVAVVPAAALVVSIPVSLACGRGSVVVLFDASDSASGGLQDSSLS